MNTFADFLDPMDAIRYLDLMISIMVCLLALIFFSCQWFVNKAKTQRDKQRLDALAAERNRAVQHRYPAVITGKALFLQVNEEYFDAILSGFVRSLLRAGYTLSDREVAPSLLLPKATLDVLAREGDRVRQEYLRGLGEDIEDDIRYHMESGRAQTFLMQMIGSCERLGWKVIPVVREPEEECASSFSALP